jgi:hypothetical protein
MADSNVKLLYPRSTIRELTTTIRVTNAHIVRYICRNEGDGDDVDMDAGDGDADDMPQHSPTHITEK